MSRDNGILYVPTYHLIVHEGNDKPCMYHGCLADTGGGVSFQEIIRTFYDGNLFALLLTLSWGGRESRDVAILEALGLAYRSFRCDVKGKNRKHFAWQDDAWRPIKSVNPLTMVFEYLSKRKELVGDLALEIGSRWDGVRVEDDSVGEHKLRDLVDFKEGKKRNVLWMGEIVRCDVCDHGFTNDQYMVDAATAQGPWANMCAHCFERQGAQIGWGKGQLYLRTSEGWLLVAGFGPEEEEAA
jgi:hypothetical protein